VEEVSKQTSQEAWGAHFLDWQEHSQTLDGIGAYDSASWTLVGGGEPERVEVGNVSAGLLPLLGVQPLPPGRNFKPTEDKPGGERVAILSHALWQRRYHGEPDIVGRSITLNDVQLHGDRRVCRRTSASFIPLMSGCLWLSIHKPSSPALIIPISQLSRGLSPG
jgi:hypothetical protein